MVAQRYLILAPEFPPALGGIQTYLAGVAGALGPDALVLAPDGPGAGAFDRGRAERIERVPDRRGLRSLPGWFAAGRRALAGGSFETLVVGHVRLGPVGLALGRARGVPVTVLAYGMEVTAGRFRRVKRTVWGAADRVVAISRYTADRVVEEGARRSRLSILPPGLDPPAPVRPEAVLELRRSLALPDGPVLLTVGRLDSRERYKGHEEVLRAIPGLAGRFAGLTWLVAGDGDDRPRLEAEARRLGAAASVRFLGRVEPAIVPVLHRLADVFVMPSRVARDGRGLRFEGFGIVYLEAAAAERPVVAGRAAGALDAVEDGRTGLLVDPESPDEIAGAVASLVEDPERARRMGRAGRDRLEREFLWSRLPVAARLSAAPGGTGR